MVRLVSNQSDDDMRRREARDALVWPLRELTANLLRIANGAGKPVALMKQLRACHEALRAYAEAHSNALPSDYDIQQILDCDLAWEEIRAPRSILRRPGLGPESDPQRSPAISGL